MGAWRGTGRGTRDHLPTRNTPTHPAGTRSRAPPRGAPSYLFPRPRGKIEMGVFPRAQRHKPQRRQHARRRYIFPAWDRTVRAPSDTNPRGATSDKNRRGATSDTNRRGAPLWAPGGERRGTRDHLPTRNTPTHPAGTRSRDPARGAPSYLFPRPRGKIEMGVFPRTTPQTATPPTRATQIRLPRRGWNRRGATSDTNRRGAIRHEP